MHIVEYEPHGISTHGLNSRDHAVALAPNGQALFRAVALDFSAGAHDPQILGAEIVARAILEADAQDPAVFSEPQLTWPRAAMTFLHALPRYYLQPMNSRSATKFAVWRG